MNREPQIIEIARDWLRMLPDLVDAIQLLAAAGFVIALAVALHGVSTIVRAWRDRQ